MVGVCTRVYVGNYSVYKVKNLCLNRFLNSKYIMSLYFCDILVNFMSLPLLLTFQMIRLKLQCYRNNGG